MIKAIISNNCDVVAILGMEYSPSCAVRYQYTYDGVINQQGIFIEELNKILDRKKIYVHSLERNSQMQTKI
ncbi:MAG: hypothetical protein B6U87_00940 [Candidatus Aenigmarchaeota archaeon ex4484_52]|nr:MAG: hypothetical protein B6U87_00940 [Candidatus Aenigmarchaeota archaeon ex4484_52]